MEYVGSQPLRFWLCAAGVVGMLIGSIGPWVSVVIASENGLDAGDGWIGLGAGVFAAVGLARYGAGRTSGLVGVLLGGGIGFATAAYDWYHIHIQALVSPGWGLQLAAIASIAVAADAVYLALNTPRHGYLQEHRKCPSCKEQMLCEAHVCPHCRRESQPWTLHRGLWWLRQDTGWHYYATADQSWHLFDPSVDQIEPPTESEVSLEL